MATINERVPFVLLMLGNRADLTTGNPSRVQNWIWQSYLNLGMGYKFAEAEVTVETQLALGESTIAYPDDGRAITNITPYRPDGTPITLLTKNIQYLRRYGNQPNLKGPPGIWAPYGQLIYFRPVADNVYNLIIDYWQKPVQDPDDIGETELNVPDDWLEIVDLGAALRGHISLIERDKAQEIQQLLFGFTVPTTGKQVPGLIGVNYTRMQAQAPTQDWGMAPKQSKRSYTSVP